ncbi:hypothetical protein GCM10010279_47910 [Streptomyces mutabilis]|nr:hypothetical protein GCM10010279_47910 [Streptomyces mutabilis]
MPSRGDGAPPVGRFTARPCHPLRRAPTREAAGAEGGHDAAVHQQAAGDEGGVGAERERGRGGDVVGGVHASGSRHGDHGAHRLAGVCSSKSEAVADALIGAALYQLLTRTTETSPTRMVNLVGILLRGGLRP